MMALTVKCRRCGTSDVSPDIVDPDWPPGKPLCPQCAKEWEAKEAMRTALAAGNSGSSPLFTQVGGCHYKDLAIQPVEYNQRNGLGFIEGSVVKYVTRHKSKNGEEDIKKATHFLQMLLEIEYPDALSSPIPPVGEGSGMGVSAHTQPPE